LLNKLAKVGSVLELAANTDCEPIEITSRKSDRVPFGTGAAVINITDLEDPVEDFRFYNPAVFEMLGLWLQSWPAIWQSQSTDFEAVINSEVADKSKNNWRALITGLLEIKTEQALVHAFRQSKDFEQFTKQMHTWFDAFRTLKLIHSLRDSGMPGIEYAALIYNQTYARFLTMDSDLKSFHNRLQSYLA